MAASLVKTPYLTGEVVDREVELQPLRDEIDQLKSDLRKMRQERDTARADGLAAQSAIAALRDVLGPLRRAIGAIYGEIDAAGIPESQAPAPSPSLGQQPAAQPSSRWSALTTKLGGLRARFIQALLDFGPSTVTGIRAATGMSKQSAYNTANDLTKLGLITRKGSQYALKE
jgi:hypothetical protein